MSKHITENLNNILTNIAGQKVNIETNLAAASAAAHVPDADVQAAIDVLVERYKDVQVIGKIIGAQMALKQLEAASKEVAILEVSIRVGLDDAHFLSKIVQQMSADVISEAATG